MAPQATPISTVDEIDEAIWWVLMTAPRNIDYMKIVDALLDQRNQVSAGAASPSGSPRHPVGPAAHPKAPTDRAEDHRETRSSK